MARKDENVSISSLQSSMSATATSFRVMSEKRNGHISLITKKEVKE